MSEPLTFSWEVPHAKVSPSRESGLAWMTRVATWQSSFFDLLHAFASNGSSLKTSLASCRRTEDGILEPSSGSWANAGMGSPTAFWTLNTSEFPNDADVCSLSDVLETQTLPQRYYLSALACRGVLRRAAKRGKELPKALRLALEAVASQTVPPPLTPDAKMGLSEIS